LAAAAIVSRMVSTYFSCDASATITSISFIIVTFLP
jgi:hypothetical protein